MEGVHFVAGPWFTVRKSDEQRWLTLERIWISDGKTNELADIQFKVSF